MTTTNENARYAAGLPVLLLSVAVIGAVSLHTWLMFQDSRQLAQSREGLVQPLNNAKQLQQQLDQLATSTQALAQQGNATAQAMVADLQKHGISIKAP